jgi:ABC-type transport system involved in multi-copper enzyme maturation permease subunit
MKPWLRLIRAEVRKLTSTRIVWGFLLVLVGISALTGIAVVWGTDMDGSKAFVSTEADQRSLMAFAANALMGAGLFGAIAVAREYGHGTVVPTFLAAPRRHRAVLAQYAAVFLGGGALGLVGAGLTVTAVAVTLPTTEYGFMVSISGVVTILVAAAIAGGAGTVLGAGIGALVRNTGGAVTGAVLALIIAPPLIVQLASGAASWVPQTLANVLSGVAQDVSRPAAAAALVLWAGVPALVGIVAVQRRDVV